MFKNNYDIKLTGSLQKQNSRRAKKKHQEDLVSNDAYAKFEEERPWEKATARLEGRSLTSPAANKDDDESGFDFRGDHGIGDLHLAARLGNVNRIRQLIEWEGEVRGSEERRTEACLSETFSLSPRSSLIPPTTITNNPSRARFANCRM